MRFEPFPGCFDVPDLSVGSKMCPSRQQAERCPSATSAARPTASLPPDVANHHIWPSRSERLTGASATSILILGESGKSSRSSLGHRLLGGVCFPISRSCLRRRRGEGCSPQEPSRASCSPIFTALVLPPPQAWSGSLWSSSLAGDRTTQGPRGGCSPPVPCLTRYRPREVTSSPCTVLALSKAATLPKITCPSSPSAAAAAYGFVTHIGDTN